MSDFIIKNGTLTAYQGDKKDIIIPAEVETIDYNAFSGNTELRSVVVPGTVKKIDIRAFANCKNLENVTLNEGIEVIESNVFTGCEKLKSMTYPDSVSKYQGWTFYGTNLSEPVMNASGTVLVFCPESVSGETWSVPDSVKTISWQAFVEHKKLTHLCLPEGLEKIENMAFIECGLQEITIPYSVREIGKGAFCRCEHLKKVTILNPAAKVAFGAFAGCYNLETIQYGELSDTDEILHLMGYMFLNQNLEDSANLHHTIDPRFIFLTARCAKGDSDAMYSFAVFFEQYSLKKNASAFYIRAANYWRYRAYQKKNAKAVMWFKQYFSEHPGECLESILYENNDEIYSNAVPGKMLNDLGFLFFDPRRKYNIWQYGNEGLVEASAFYRYDGPDETGFGAEDNDEWWFLDENMQPIPGVRSLIAESRERNHSFFQDERNKALEIIQKRKK